MAEEIVVIYRAEIDELRKQINAAAEAQERLGENAEDTLAIYTKVAQIEQKAAKIREQEILKERARLAVLIKLRKQAYSVTDIQKFNAEIRKSQQNIKVLNGELTKQTQSIDSFAGNIGKKLAGAVAGIFTIDSIINFGKASVEAFLEAEEAAKQLEFAVLNVSKEGKEGLDRLNKSAENLSESFNSVFSKQDIQLLQTQLIQYGLIGDQIEELTPKIIDLASAQGITLSQAASNVIQAIEGQGKALQQLGIVLDNDLDTYGKYESVLNGLTKFTGAAAAETETYTGALKNQEKAINDLQESIGERLVPVLQRLELAALEALDGFLKLFTETGRDFNTFKTRATGFVKDSGSLAKGLVDLGFEADGSAKQIDFLVRSLGLGLISLDDSVTSTIKGAKSTKDLSDRIKELANSQALVNDAGEKGLLTQDNAIKANQLYQKEIVRLTEAIKTFGQEDDKLLSVELLRVESTENLNKLLEENKDLTDLVSRTNVERIEAELKKRGELQDALEKYIASQQRLFKQLGELRIQPANPFDEELRVQAEEGAKQIEDLVESNGISVEQARKVILAKLGIQSESFLAILIDEQLAFNKFIDDSLKKQGEAVDESGKKLGGGLAAFTDSISVQLDLALEIRDTLINVFSSLTDARIQEIDRELDALRERNEIETEILQGQRDERLISEKDFQEKQLALQQKIKDEEERLRVEKNKAAKKQAIIERSAAIFDIALNTAVAISRALRDYPFPLSTVISALMGTLGAVQTAAVIAQPIPKYARGTKGTKDSGMALVGEEGPEMTFLPQGTKVIPARQTKQHSDVFDAIYDNRFEDYVLKNFVTPSLIAQKKDFEAQKSKDFATNIVNSIQGLSYYDLEHSRKKGMKITNVNEFAKVVAEAIKTNPRFL